MARSFKKVGTSKTTLTEKLGELLTHDFYDAMGRVTGTWEKQGDGLSVD